MEKITLDYATFQQMIMWRNNFRYPDEALTKELFIEHMSQNSLHYWEKFSKEFQCDIYKMLRYFSDDVKQGQEFCDMMAVQIEKYQQRISK